MHLGEIILVLSMAAGVVIGMIMAFGDSRRKRVVGAITCISAMVILAAYVGIILFLEWQSRA